MPEAILDPTGGQRTASAGTAVLTRERARLDGATIGLLSNTKQNAALFLDELGRLLVSRHGVAAVKPVVKKSFALPVPDDQLAELKDSCDAVITGVGDCGSCSASAVADGVAFERNGVPAAVICSDAFVVTADAMAELRDAKGYHYAKTAHPVAVLNPDEVRKRAEDVLPEIVNILTKP
ncbi:UGSC family (seleno)protein [Amycolatopsis sp. GM8]|uniref:UGSC family (seleno)protein n=1 Tax=Amycolatopsis sp. GM8 TaxID=2896530 RepID=UPI001F47418C|nr:UGSC family (seleno)protein [Amycolatopsis sp. GM8]